MESKEMTAEMANIQCDIIKKEISRSEIDMKNFGIVENYHTNIETILSNEDNFIHTVFSDVQSIVKDYIDQKKEKEKAKENAVVQFSFLKRYVKRSTWSSKKKHPKIILSRQGSRIESKSYGWKTVFSNQLLTEGDYFFELELSMFRKKQLSIVGVVNPQEYFKNYGNNFEHEIGKIGFCLDLSSGDRLYKGKVKKYLKPVPRRGDVIGIIVNLNTKQIFFTMNGTKFGVAFSGKKVKAPLCIVVSMFLSNQKFTFLLPKL